ncbi:MAG: bifunctional diaminohydroxyphosphoribosylaminopyrimidine deaminase/5-amino-6-(5-phosphoribosylamino)uracil reductase RibD [Spirochaetales bacterium]|nr:bifunctional diaminohydroxyphosphoribosylaminopyrimidine deaminase/5-amino-6-(5-phosphoribosylamino)uracil reductase RibD [Spirochaetales bacterium]
MKSNEIFMKRALDLARKGEGSVLPNPQVGAVIVRNGKILGEGWHARYGGIHAEQAALENCREDPSGADLYVTLEPCCHRGAGKHNPPCTEAICRAGIKRVFIARLDPNPRVSGKAAALLKSRGIKVVIGIKEEESASLNRVYESLIKEERPYVHLKAALTADGFMADSNGSSQWISGPESRRKVMEFRSASDAIMVGRGTLFADHPSLTVRDPRNRRKKGPQPARVFLSSGGYLPAEWNKQGGDVHIYHDRNRPVPPGNSTLHFHGINPTPDGLALNEILTDLRSRRIHTLLVEGGSRIFGSFLKSGQWDRISLFIAPHLLGKGLPLSPGLNIPSLSSKLSLKNVSYEQFGDDIMLDAYREEIRCLPV